MLGLAIARFLHERDDGAPQLVDVVSFRGGPLEADFLELAPTTVLLDPHEPWDHSDPPVARVRQLEAIGERLPDVDLALLVSVAAGQCLTVLKAHQRTVTWVVERGEDLHWIGPPVDLADRTDQWIAGSTGSLEELVGYLGTGTEIVRCREFIDAAPPSAGEVERIARFLRPDGTGPLVMGAGIGTWRKAPDLFVELALMYRARTGEGVFVWIGGEADPLVPLLRDEVDRLGAAAWIRFVDSAERLQDWLAAADAFCLTSRLDAYPLVCIQAAAAGTPVFAFGDTTGVPEMLGEEFRGVDYPDLDAMADLLASYSSDGLIALGRAQQPQALEHTAPAAAPALLAEIARGMAIST